MLIGSAMLTNLSRESITSVLMRFKELSSVAIRDGVNNMTIESY